MGLSRWLDLVGSVLPYSMKPWIWESKSDQWTSRDIPDLSGMVALITGANGGVGLETSLELFRNGAHVLMGCRSMEKYEMAKKNIMFRLKTEEQRGKLSYLHVDTSTIRTSQQAAQNLLIQKEIKRLDIFIGCAGRGSKVGPLNEDGVEPFMATNCLGHLAILLPLLPLLIQTSKSSTRSSRIVFVSSVAEQWSSLPWPFAHSPTFSSWDEINDTKRGERGLYSSSKILTIKRLNWELGNENISCLAIHPGELNNNFVQEMIPPFLFPYIRSLLGFVLLNALEGARTCLFAATSEQVDNQCLRGVFITYPVRVKEPSSLACDMTLADKLWTLQTDLIQQRSRKEN